MTAPMRWQERQIHRKRTLGAALIQPFQHAVGYLALLQRLYDNTPREYRNRSALEETVHEIDIALQDLNDVAQA